MARAAHFGFEIMKIERDLLVRQDEPNDVDKGADRKAVDCDIGHGQMTPKLRCGNSKLHCSRPCCDREKPIVTATKGSIAPRSITGIRGRGAPGAQAERYRQDGAIHDQSGGGDEGEAYEAGIGRVNHDPSAYTDDEYPTGNSEQGPERPPGGLKC